MLAYCFQAGVYLAITRLYILLQTDTRNFFCYVRHLKSGKFSPFTIRPFFVLVKKWLITIMNVFIFFFYKNLILVFRNLNIKKFYVYFQSFCFLFYEFVLHLVVLLFSLKFIKHVNSYLQMAQRMLL